MLYEDHDSNDYQVLESSETDKPTSLSESIRVLTKDLNEHYIDDCLLNILNNFVRKNHNSLLGNKFFPELKIEELTDLHLNLKEDLKFVELDFRKIGEVFKKYENDFLIYCEVLAKMKTLMEFFKEKMSHNEEVINDVGSMTRESKREGVNKKLKEDLLELIQRIPQAIMRFPMALEDVAKQARKSNEARVEREAKKAHETMKNVMDHINWYSKDYKNIELVDNMQDGMDAICKLKDYGVLIYEVDDVGIHFKKQELKNFPKFKLLVFEEVFAAFERKEIQKFVKQSDGSVKMSVWGEPISSTFVKFNFIQTFRISKFSEISSNSCNKNLILNTYEHGARLDRDRSLEIQFATEDGRQQFMERLQERQKIISNLDNAKPGSKHKGHKFKKYQNDISFDNQVNIYQGL